jgi:hypothetical protein
MKLVKKATPAAIAVLRQATAIAPLRMKASDGLLPSKSHLKQNPVSDHNTGLAVDLTHDKLAGIDCADIFERLKKDNRVKYLIFKGRIWSQEKGERPYTGSNPHNKHLHISIKDNCGKDDSHWFPWLLVKKVEKKAVFKTADAARNFAMKLKPLPKKKENK